MDARASGPTLAQSEDSLRAKYARLGLYVRKQVYSRPDGVTMVVGGWAFLDGAPAILPTDLDGLRCVRPPIDITEVPVGAHWHERFQDDPAHRFFRELVIESLEGALATRRADTRSRCRVGDRPRRRAGSAARSTLRE